MKKIVLAFLLSLSMVTYSKDSLALNQTEAEDLADFTAIFIFLKKNCGYSTIQNNQIKQAIIYFSKRNRWDLSNYNKLNMGRLGEESYNDLVGIRIPSETKCRALARDALTLLAYVH